MGAVLVHIDLEAGLPHPSSLAALAAGRAVASSWGAALYASFVMQAPSAADGAPRVMTAKVPGIAAAQQALARGGADKLVVALTPAPIDALWAAVGTAWQAVLDHLRPRLVLFGADAPSAIELGPRTGARIGARLLARARTTGADVVELRDRDGGYVRAADGGAAVAMVGEARPFESGGDTIQVIPLAVPGGTDPRIEIAGSVPGEHLHANVVIALGEDASGDPEIVAAAKHLAILLGAQVLTGPARGTPICPELCIAVGMPAIDLAGAASLIRIGTSGGKGVDGALAGPAASCLAELARTLEDR